MISDRGLCWSKKGDLEKAIADYGEAIRLDPKDALTYANRADAWFRKSDYNKAISDATEAIRLEPNFRDAYLARADARSAAAQYDKAIADYSEAMKIDATFAEPYTGRSWCWLKKQEFEKAIADATEAIKRDPKSRSGFVNRAMAWAAKKEFDKAMSDCSEAERIESRTSPFNEVAWFLATSADAAFRDGRKSIEFASGACEKTEWKNGNYLDTLACAYAEAGDFETAVKWETNALAVAVEADKARLQSRLDLFKSGKPYRETLK
jgi:tetratricopeptide (TPR) repeat protein